MLFPVIIKTVVVFVDNDGDDEDKYRNVKCCFSSTSLVSFPQHQ